MQSLRLKTKLIVKIGHFFHFRSLQLRGVGRVMTHIGRFFLEGVKKGQFLYTPFFNQNIISEL